MLKKVKQKKRERGIEEMESQRDREEVFKLNWSFFHYFYIPA